MNSHSSGRRQWEGGCALEARGVRPRREGRCGVQDPKAFSCIAGDLPLWGGFAGKLGGAAACWRRAVARIIRGGWSQPQRAHSGNTNLIPRLGSL